MWSLWANKAALVGSLLLATALSFSIRPLTLPNSNNNNNKRGVGTTTTTTTTTSCHLLGASSSSSSSSSYNKDGYYDIEKEEEDYSSRRRIFLMETFATISAFLPTGAALANNAPLLADEENDFIKELKARSDSNRDKYNKEARTVKKLSPDQFTRLKNRPKYVAIRRLDGSFKMVLPEVLQDLQAKGLVIEVYDTYLGEDGEVVVDYEKGTIYQFPNEEAQAMVEKGPIKNSTPAAPKVVEPPPPPSPVPATPEPEPEPEPLSLPEPTPEPLPAPEPISLPEPSPEPLPTIPEQTLESFPEQQPPAPETTPTTPEISYEQVPPPPAPLPIIDDPVPPTPSPEEEALASASIPAQPVPLPPSPSSLEVMEEAQIILPEELAPAAELVNSAEAAVANLP